MLFCFCFFLQCRTFEIYIHVLIPSKSSQGSIHVLVNDACMLSRMRLPAAHSVVLPL